MAQLFVQSEMTQKSAAASIFLISLSTLMFELVVNKALSFSTWGSLGYMVIGSAIFGFALAGVYLGINRREAEKSLSYLLVIAALFFSFSVLASYAVMNLVPFNFGALPSQPFRQIVYFATWYLVLLFPFTAAGFIITLLLSNSGSRCNRLYGFDLLGAGIGCAVMIPLLPLVGPEGEYLLCAAIGAASGLVSALGVHKRLAGACLVLMISCGLAVPLAQSSFPVKTHQEKRDRLRDWKAGNIKLSMWSYISKIEVAFPSPPDDGIIWFDGGLMQSSLDRFDGNYESAKVSSLISGANSIPYRLKHRENALIIGPSGGREVRAALTWGTEKVTGVELDPSVVRLVQGPLDGFLGKIYDNGRTRLINEEGRSFIRRSSESFDVIQLVSTYSVAAIHSGALTQMSSYLTTTEAFSDYLEHLSPDGVLSMSMRNNLRLFFTAWNALLKRGLDPEGKLVLILNDHFTYGRNTLLLKLSDFTATELEVLKNICIAQKMRINYAPARLSDKVGEHPEISAEPKTKEILEQFVRQPSGSQRIFFARFPYKVEPATDDKPFFQDVRYNLKKMTADPQLLNEDMQEQTEGTAYRMSPTLPISTIPSLFVLFEAALFLIIILILPIRKHKSEGIRMRWQQFSMGYFLCLGIGFIWVEIVLLKKFILFLGNPVYSISVVLAIFLMAAGLGSFISERLPARGRLPVLSALLVLSLFFASVVPNLLFLHFLGYSLPIRVLVSILLLAPVGLVLGMPFPVGMRFLGESSPGSIAWAWAANGYTTVVGVSSATLMLPYTGFSKLLLLAIGVYLIGFFCLSRGMRLQCYESSKLTSIVSSVG